MKSSDTHRPYATAAVFLVTAVCTSLQFSSLHLNELLRRTPTALAHHEWWRLISPVLINPEGWRQIAVNFSALLVLGVLVERRFGAARWLGIYFTGALVGELAGYAWQPSGGGSSVGVAGLLGAFAAMLATAAAPPARAGAVLIGAGALALCYFRDLHGPPILAGFALALVLHRLANPPRPRK